MSDMDNQPDQGFTPNRVCGDEAGGYEGVGPCVLEPDHGGLHRDGTQPFYNVWFDVGAIE